MEVEEPKPVVRNRATPIGVLGLAVALIALAIAATKPWIVDAIAPMPPESKALVNVKVQVSEGIKDRITGIFKRKPATEIPSVSEVATPLARHERMNRQVGLIVAVISVIAMAVGTVGLVMRHNTRLNIATIAIGVAAMAFHYVLFIAAVVIVLWLLSAFIN